MKYFWTRFNIHYPQTIIYMLQGSEYRLKDYFAWLRRTNDFRFVMKRRELDYTKAAVLLLAGVWSILFVLYALVFILLIRAEIPAVILASIIFLVSPVLAAYVIVVPLWLGHILIKKPRNKKMVETARRIIANHTGLKIAIAGSYGKTTAKEVLRTVLAEGKKVAFTPGNMNTIIGISRFACTLKGDEDVIIFELGEEKVGDVSKLCALAQPDIGIITGIAEAHLSSFGTIERAVETIFELQQYLGDKPLYKNIESPLVDQKASKGDELVFSRKGTDGWRVSDVKTNIHGTAFRVAKGKKSMSVHTGLLGNHNIGIVAVAVSIADSIGLTPAQIVAGIEKTVPFEHRMQPRQLHGAWVIDDTYNGNSQGVQVGLALLKNLDAKRRIYITPGLVEQGHKTREIHEDIGRQIAKVADFVVLMQNSVTDYILSGLRDAKYDGKLLIIDNPLEFYTNLDQFVASGDVVLMQNDWTDNYA